MAMPKPSAAQFAYESLKEWVLSGFLIPGEKVDQDAAAKKLNLSRMPVRSALDRLASEGLVIKVPHRGVVVSSLSDVSLNHLFDLRAQVEAMAIAITATTATATSIEKLYNMLNYQQDDSDFSMTTVLSQNRSFHRCIAQMADSEILLRTFDNLWEQSERYRRIYYQMPDSNERILIEHRHLVDLIAEHNAQAAADFIVEHTRTSQKALLDLMNKTLPAQKFHLIVLA